MPNRIAERLLAEIAELRDNKVVLWSAGKDRHGHFSMSGTNVVGIPREEAVQHLATTCRYGGGVIVQRATGQKAPDGHEIIEVCGFGCSQMLYTRLSPEEVAWSLSTDPKTFEPLRLHRHLRYT